MYLIGGRYPNGQGRFTPQSLISMTTTPHNSSSSRISSKTSKSCKSKSNAHTPESGLVWERCTPLPVAMTLTTAVSVRAGIIVIDIYTTSLYLYRTDTKRWSQLDTPLPLTMSARRHGSTIIIDPSSGDECLVITSGTFNVAWTMNMSTLSSISSSPAASASACQWIRFPSQRVHYSMQLVPLKITSTIALILYHYINSRYNSSMVYPDSS
jgi:hypothetical protein